MGNDSSKHPIDESNVIEESIVCTSPSTYVDNTSSSQILIQNSVNILTSYDSCIRENDKDLNYVSNKLKRKHSDASSIDSNLLSPTLPDGVDKAAVRRHKNNEASKVTRAKRRCREKELYEKEQELLKSNA